MDSVKLPSDFTLERYGLNVRLVNEDDAEFIVQLRTDPKLSKYIHSTDNDINKQREWIRGYKDREAQGLEYYFIFCARGEKLCLCRIYSIKENGTYTFGSWIASPKAHMEESVASIIITNEIAFEDLKLTYADLYDGVHESNTQVYKFDKMLGANFTSSIMDVKGKYYIGELTKESFYKSADKLKRLLNLQR
jgi:RimJ/RimL family protein N-acetyltransferase